MTPASFRVSLKSTDHQLDVGPPTWTEPTRYPMVLMRFKPISAGQPVSLCINLAKGSGLNSLTISFPPVTSILSNRPISISPTSSPPLSWSSLRDDEETVSNAVFSILTIASWRLVDSSSSVPVDTAGSVPRRKIVRVKGSKKEHPGRRRTRISHDTKSDGRRRESLGDSASKRRERTHRC